MSSVPRAVRFEPAVLERLRRYLRARPGPSASALTSRSVDEGLRMEEHPGLLFRDGPSGRRAVLVRAVQSARGAEPDLDAEEAERAAEELWQRERRLLS
jgi:hypothetical protein